MEDSENYNVKEMALDLPNSDLEAEVKLPYIIEDKIIMSPGLWNKQMFLSEEIELAYNNTDWEDRDIRALYYEHEDGNKDPAGKIRKAKWLGEVINPRLEKINGDTILKADLLIVNKYRTIDPPINNKPLPLKAKLRPAIIPIKMKFGCFSLKM